MAYVKWTIIIVIWTVIAAFLHYTLPQHDVVRVTDTYETRVNPGENRWFWAQADAGSNPAMERDVFFIQTRRAKGDVMVYRNEDTAWGWPPYFKFDTSNLQAEAADLRSTADNPQWVVVRHYGWRNELFSIFPNAISLRPVSGPDVRVIPWLTIILLVLLLAIIWAIWVRWRRFRERRVDPALESVGDRIDDGGSWLRGLFRSKPSGSG